MSAEAMAEAMVPPMFGAEFDPEELLRLRKSGVPPEQVAKIGL